MSISIDDEWNQFLSSQQTDLFGSILNKQTDFEVKQEKDLSTPKKASSTEEQPECDELSISTKTKVLFLNQEVDIHNIFWEIPIIKYWKPDNGIIKKQIKLVSNTVEEYDIIRKKIDCVSDYKKEDIIKQINNPKARRNKFKDERKITVGISRKDIINRRSKIKGAFYNCFALVMRFNENGFFREIHVKIFNTGKLEIPGIVNSTILDVIKNMIVQYLQPYLKTPIEFIENDTEDNVLINSNFNCGYYINRDKLYTIMRTKYGIETAYDQDSYPGVKCKFYFNNTLGFDEELQKGVILSDDRNMKMSELNDNKKYTEVNFMIFRTGNALIVGNFSEKILRFVFEFIKKILNTEYSEISIANDCPKKKKKEVKIRNWSVNISV